MLSLLLVVVAVVVAAAVESSSPLFLSKYLNNPSVGRNLSRVHGTPYRAATYSGYFTLGKGRNTFFWYFENSAGDANAPVMTWLQGGPGASSMFGLFSENGPFSVAEDGVTLVPRNYSWTNKFNMIYIDNPLGVGYSFTEDKDGFVTNEDEVGVDLFLFLEQFFTIFDEVASNPLFIAGESYGGKYAPSSACYLHEQIVSGRSSLNLQGVSIGDGAIDPATQFTGFGDLLFYMGLADINERQVIRGYEKNISMAIANQDWPQAFAIFDAMLNGDFYPYPTLFRNITGLTDYFNFIQPVYPPNPYQSFLNGSAAQAMLHVGQGRTFWDYNATVERYLIGDWMKPVTKCLSTLVENYRVLVYNGQNDIILGAALTEEALYSLQWAGQWGFNSAQKTVWRDSQGSVSGYARVFSNLTHVIVRNAGHMVPADSPASAYDMITRFVSNKGFQ